MAIATSTAVDSLRSCTEPRILINKISRRCAVRFRGILARGGLSCSCHEYHSRNEKHDLAQWRSPSLPSIGFSKLYPTARTDVRTSVQNVAPDSAWVLPFFEQHGIVLCRGLTDRGTEHCGNPEHLDYKLYLAVEDVDHTRTKRLQTNGLCERFHRTVLKGFYRVAFRKRICGTIDERDSLKAGGSPRRMSRRQRARALSR